MRLPLLLAFALLTSRHNLHLLPTLCISSLNRITMSSTANASSLSSSLSVSAAAADEIEPSSAWTLTRIFAHAKDHSFPDKDTSAVVDSGRTYTQINKWVDSDRGKSVPLLLYTEFKCADEEASITCITLMGYKDGDIGISLKFNPDAKLQVKAALQQLLVWVFASQFDLDMLNSVYIYNTKATMKLLHWLTKIHRFQLLSPIRG